MVSLVDMSDGKQMRADVGRRKGVGGELGKREGAGLCWEHIHERRVEKKNKKTSWHRSFKGCVGKREHVNTE